MRPRTGELVLAALAAAFALAPAPARAAGPLELTAAVDRTELREDEVLVLTVRVESDEATPSVDVHEQALPFRILSRTWSTEAAPGDGSGAGPRRVHVLTLALSPRRTGKLVIPPVVATARGVRRRTAAMGVEVTAVGAGPRAAQAPDRSGGSWRGWERDLVLDAEVDRREAFLGEPVIATVWLLSPAGVVDTESYQPPSYDGFWVEELERPRRLTFQVRNVRGVPTRAYALQKLALFPTRAGPLELGPFRIEVVLRLGSDSPLSPLADLRRARRASAPVALRVKPLPPGAPPGFQAVNVGSFSLAASTSDRSVAAGQPVSIRVTAAGEGNVRALALPRLPALPGVRAFEPTATDELRPRGGRLAGSRTLETVLVPEAPGELVVPALAWSFFDPRAGRYETARTEPVRITVLPGAPAAPAAGAPPRPAAVEPLPIRADGALAARGPPPWTRPPFLAAVALPPLAFAGLVLADAWRRRSAERGPARRARAAGRQARRRLRAARRGMAARPEEALAAVERALSGYAADRLGRGTAALTRRELGEALLGAGAREAGTVALAEALDACDAARFGGAAAPEDVLARAERALALLEASPWQAPGRRA